MIDFELNPMHNTTGRFAKQVVLYLRVAVVVAITGVVYSLL